jgi:CysZ protein
MEWFAGLRLIAANRTLWPLCARPLLWAVTAYLILGSIAWALVVPRIASWFAASASGAFAAGLFGSLLFAIVWLFLFSYLFVILASLFAGFLWEGLARQVESLSGGAAQAVPLPASTLVFDAGARFSLSLLVGLLALVGTLVIGPLSGWLAASLLCLLDYTSPAYLRRGLPLWSQAGRALRAKSLGFALVAGAVSLLPILNVLLWPVAITGGTLLARKLEGALQAMNEPPGK